jgi:hypothetical protein
VWDVEVESYEVSTWVLLPKGKEYGDFRLIRWQTVAPGATEDVELVSQYLAEDSTILAFKLLALKPGSTYKLTWQYK